LQTARASCHTIGEAEVDHEGHSRESGAEPVAWAVRYARLEIEIEYVYLDLGWLLSEEAS